MKDAEKLLQLFLQVYAVQDVYTTITHDTSIEGFIRGEFHTPSHGVHYTKYFPEDVYAGILVLGVATFMQQTPEDITLTLSSETTYGFPFSKLFNMMEFVYSAYASPNSTINVTEDELWKVSNECSKYLNLHTPITPSRG